MKNLTKISLAAAVIATLGIAFDTSADGIAASPKVQQMLNERAARAVAAAPVAGVTYRTPALDEITASPKVRQFLAERKVVVSSAPGSEVASAGYNPTGNDGVTASPKLRAQLNERNAASIVIAPLK